MASIVQNGFNRWFWMNFSCSIIMCFTWFVLCYYCTLWNVICSFGHLFKLWRILSIWILFKLYVIFKCSHSISIFTDASSPFSKYILTFLKLKVIIYSIMLIVKWVGMWNSSCSIEHGIWCMILILFRLPHTKIIIIGWFEESAWEPICFYVSPIVWLGASIICSICWILWLT